ncbi:MAG TPA: hypothetical protein DDX89_00100 [Candidatus Omnitrophica bacterium]|nr:MAG: hypothetical protein A2Z92_00635 [Omnitrophica WOR_2 bacterium GWA2_63_20]OGX17685.1 MAG: hypothetical protein A2105_05680 [Omnitrophica WOR_2 bacterium GWF2_63_9]OGX32469.1 MAG: hypothetical protein A3E56_03715 [Omnitrophica WOR_2 bacterium RIFCSPHIGHO2_12_FULL_64_13]OGX36259.1 MAG: hypothetical protein A3B73_03185 [Omnitrophica WOR_2 bacterium RIFCSPHIGHO2_02_FULL_63_39]OGX46134.1 MAG: hypothetical protein A3I71_06665 [Omnitrophica WOR_2 bacterium RIFCSPLOWO2_02_FULL_63_16]HAM40501.1
MERRLGKGLAELIDTSPQAGGGLVQLRVEQIRPGRHQPRQTFDAATLEELKASIKTHGVMQPIVVRPVAHGTYELVAGERRWRAAQALGLPEIPAIVKPLSDQEALEGSLIENLQRENLNPLEEASAYQRLMEEFAYTQEQLAEAVGKDRSSVANALRLLRLPEEIQRAVRGGKLSAGHAKVLGGVEPPARQIELFRHAATRQMSVRQLEELCGKWQPKAAKRRRAQDPQLALIEDELRRLLGTKVTLASRRKGGRIIIEYFSTEDFTRIIQALKVAV